MTVCDGDGEMGSDGFLFVVEVDDGTMGDRRDHVCAT